MPRFLLGLAAALALGITGCAVSERVTYADEEGPISDRLLDSIKKKDTEKAWVLSQLGQPFAIDRVQTTGQNPLTLYEVYTYRFSRSKVRSGHVLYLFRAGARQDDVEYFHVAFEKDRVQKAWTDNVARAQVGARLREEEGGTKVITPQQAQTAKSKWKLPILKKWFGKKDDIGEQASKQESPDPDSSDAMEEVQEEQKPMSDDSGADAQST